MSVDVVPPEAAARAADEEEMRQTFATALKRDARRRRLTITLCQIGLLAALLLAWQYLPDVDWLREQFNFLDPYFISSPSEIASKLADLLSPGPNEPHLWDFAWPTIKAALLGTFIGTAAGALCGLVLSNMPYLSEVLRPFIVAVNAIPRIALIPIIVILWGPSLTASVVTAITVVFFVVFFNAYEGGRTVSPEVLQNARILGANKAQLMYRVRARYVLAWTVTALPNAVSFGLISVVTAEVLTGTVGMGRLLLDSVTSVQSSLTFAVVVVLSVMGMVLVGATEVLRRRWLRWWSEQ
jgi:NitT/TauT family transport system permease protein